MKPDPVSQFGLDGDEAVGGRSRRLEGYTPDAGGRPPTSSSRV